MRMLLEHVKAKGMWLVVRACQAKHALHTFCLNSSGCRRKARQHTTDSVTSHLPLEQEENRRANGMWLVGMPSEDAVGSDVICVSGVGGQVQLEREESAQQVKPIWGQAISPTLPG